MAYLSFDKLWRFEIYNIVSAKDRVHYINLNHSKLKVNNTYKHDKKITKKFEASKDEEQKQM